MTYNALITLQISALAAAVVVPLWAMLVERLDGTKDVESE